MYYSIAILKEHGNKGPQIFIHEVEKSLRSFSDFTEKRFEVHSIHQIQNQEGHALFCTKHKYLQGSTVPLILLEFCH